MNTYTITLQSKNKQPLNLLIEGLLDFDDVLEQQNEIRATTTKTSVMADGEPQIFTAVVKLEITDEDTLARYERLIEFLTTEAPLAEEGFTIECDEPPTSV